jgi:hypothetical protein
MKKELESFIFINGIPYYFLTRNINRLILIEVWLGTLEVYGLVLKEQVNNKKWKEYVV